MSAVQSVTYEQDQAGVSRYAHIDMRQRAEVLQPFMQTRITQPFDGWREGLTSEEFLTAAKQMLRKKFDDRSTVS